MKNVDQSPEREREISAIESVAHHMIERNARVLILTPILVVEAVWRGIAEVMKARRG